MEEEVDIANLDSHLHNSVDILEIIQSLSEEDKRKFVNGDEVNLDVSPATSITVEVFGALVQIAEEYAVNRNKRILNMLLLINPEFENQPQVKLSNISNLVKKFNKLVSKGGNLEESMKKEMITISKSWEPLKKCFNFDKLKLGQIEEIGEPFEVTNEIFMSLSDFKGNYMYTSLTWSTIAAWLKSKMSLDYESSRASLSIDYKRLLEEKRKMWRRPEAMKSFLAQIYVPPQPKSIEGIGSAKSGHSDFENEIGKMKQTSQAAIDIAKEMFDCYDQMSEMAITIHNLQNCLTETTDAVSDYQKRSKIERNKIINELNLVKLRYTKVKKKLDDANAKLSRYNPRNVTKREVRLHQEISESEKQIKELENKNETLEQQFKELNIKLQKSMQRFKQEQQKVYYLKRVQQTQVDQNEKIIDLNESVESLENENEELREQLEELMEEQNIKFFHDGKYSKEIRLVYYDLLSLNVSVKNCEKVIKTVLERLANKNIDRLPRKSLGSMMMVEARLLSQMRVAEEMIQSDKNVLHLDGTKLKFEEKGSFQVVTESGSYSLAIEDMESGEANCYLDTFRNVLGELADLIIDNIEQKEKKVGELLVSIKNVMTDRHVVNGSFVQQLMKWRNDVLPEVIQNYQQLPDEDKEKMARINHVFCGPHVIHNLGVAAEAAVKQWVQIAALCNVHSGFITKNSRVYDMLYEISKLCTVAHGDQRSGQALQWTAFLKELGRENQLISFLHHRFNVFFVLGGAVYFHRFDLKNFLSTLDSSNFLQQSINADIDKKVYVSGFRALGIFNKLITGPLFRLVEQDGHIFALNNVWLSLKELLERCSQDASVLMKGESVLPGSELKKDVVFEELFKDTNDTEMDNLTLECLEIICCSCLVLIERQLKDQLPGGKYHQPSPDVMDETSLCVKTNVLSERDFAQMDRKVVQKPNITTIAASGAILFLNNQPIEWLEQKPEDFQEKAIEKIRRKAPEMIKKYREKRQLCCNPE